MHDARYNDLSEIRKLAIVCDDCGRRVVWRRQQVARAQVRYGVRSTVQLGTKLSCTLCQSRGAPGRNISVYVEAVDEAQALATGGPAVRRERIREDEPWGKGEHPDAAKPLSAFREITAVCGDCGHAKVLDEGALRALEAVPSFGALAQLAYCAACREAGATGRPNLTFHPALREPPAATPTVRWSEKPVFTDDRADPTPNLPRRNVFDRRRSP